MSQKCKQTCKIEDEEEFEKTNLPKVKIGDFILFKKEKNQKFTHTCFGKNINLDHTELQIVDTSKKPILGLRHTYSSLSQVWWKLWTN